MTTSNSLRIGVDVGGTNTDAVLLNPFAAASENRGILSWHKSPTTPNPSHGIENAITTLIENTNIDVKDIASVTIGTTHFINAIIEKDRSRLAPVAVLRLCGPFSRSVPPGVDWPSDLRSIICAYCGFLDGGLEIDGEIIRDIREDQVKDECEKVKAAGVKSIVVNGIFAPADVMGEMQEERVKEWILKYYPKAEVVLSKEVANLGFIERENAAILNASILSFARHTIASFQTAIHHRLGLSCPVFLTQNDGTILQAADAARLPIRTFNSGPTNSMCGAAFLVKQNTGISQKHESILVVDIGGTSTDVGMLLPSGLPRQAAAVTEIAGVRMNFSCPDVKSIGLGGGSIIRLSQDSAKQRVTIGPDSVGHHITTRALVFGGTIHTTTDYSVVSRASRSFSSQAIGDKDLAITAVETAAQHHDLSPDSLIDEYEAVVRKMLEGIIDRMKTSAEDVPLLLVGGGAVIVSEDKGGKLSSTGASKVIKPKFSSVANAIGAAIARVSGTIDRVVSTEGKSTQAVLEEVSKVAIDRAVENGAVRETVQIAEMDSIPIQYVANKTRVLIKAIGDFDFSRVSSVSVQEELFKHSTPSGQPDYTKNLLANKEKTTALSATEISSYRPKVVASSRPEQYEWIISELDLEWLSCGCYILGTGGGGTPYPHFVRLREMMRNGAQVRVVEPGWLKDDDVVACGGAKGSPTVSVEKLAGDEMMESQNTVYDYLGIKPAAVIDLEIGGGNGLQGLILGASTNMNIPTIDGDWMGRAYPVAWQITPVVWGGDKAQFVPSAISDGNGNNMLMLTGTTEKMVERAFRAALSEMGSHVACAKGPTTGAKVKSWAVENTISLSWRIGRAVALCRARNDIDFVSKAIIDEVGGEQAAKVLFKGKIIGVERKTVKGHVFGEVTIKAADVSGSGSGAADAVEGEVMKIPFKNENIVATRVTKDGKEEVVATVPDLICVCDASSGEAIGTPEYRYGLLVFVLGIQASEKWTLSPRGIEIGGPGAFGMDHMEYKPLGKFTKPRTVIDEFKP